MTIDHNEEQVTGYDRRSFLGKAGVGVAGFAATSAIIAACSSDDDGGGDTEGTSGGGDTAPAGTTAEEITLSQDLPEIEWDMATSWPTSRCWPVAEITRVRLMRRQWKASTMNCWCPPFRCYADGPSQYSGMYFSNCFFETAFM